MRKKIQRFLFLSGLLALSACSSTDLVPSRHSLSYVECSGVERNYEDPACEKPYESAHQQIGQQPEVASNWVGSNEGHG